MIHVTSKKHDCIETHPAGDIDTVTSTTMPFSSNPPEETSITQSSSSNALEERSTTTTPFSSNALEEPSTTTLSSSKAALVEVKAEIDTEKCKGTVKIEKKRKKRKKKKKEKKQKKRMSRCDDSPDGKRMYKDVRDNEYKELCRDVRDM